MKSSHIDFNLLIFTHEIFQQSILNVSFRQFGENLNSSSDGIYVDRQVDILIHITPATTYRANISDFYAYWDQGVSNINVNYSLLSQNHPVPCKIVSNNPALSLYHQDHAKNVFVLSTTITISADRKYLNGPKLQFRLSFGLNQCGAENDLPFNEQLITNEKEKYIRILMDRNRYVPSNLPTRYVETQVVLKQLLQCVSAVTELTATATLLTFTVHNTHRSVIVDILELQLHLQQIAVQYEKILAAQQTLHSYHHHLRQQSLPVEEYLEEVDINSEEEQEPLPQPTDEGEGEREVGHGLVPIGMVGDTGTELVCHHPDTGRQVVYERQWLHRAFAVVPLVYPVTDKVAGGQRKGFFLRPGDTKRFVYRIDAGTIAVAGWYTIPWSLYYHTLTTTQGSAEAAEEAALQQETLSWSLGTSNTITITNTDTITDTITTSVLYALLQHQYVYWLSDNVSLSPSPVQATVYAYRHDLEVAVHYPAFLSLHREFTVTLVLRNKSTERRWRNLTLFLSSPAALEDKDKEKEAADSDGEGEGESRGEEGLASSSAGLYFPLQQASLPDLGTASVVEQTIHGLALSAGRNALFPHLRLHALPSSPASPASSTDIPSEGEGEGTVCFQLLSPVSVMVI